MGDIYGKFVVILLAAVMLFYVPVTIISLKQDTTAQSYINDAVTEFVDDARATGKISGNSYENFVNRVYMANSPCTIELYHGAKYLDPEGDTEDGEDAGEEGEYLEAHEYYTTQYILDKMYANPDEKPRDYELKNGDYFKVVVYNAEPTLGARLVSVVIPGYTLQPIYESYGGYVGNNMQEL